MMRNSKSIWSAWIPDRKLFSNLDRQILRAQKVWFLIFTSKEFGVQGLRMVFGLGSKRINLKWALRSSSFLSKLTNQQFFLKLCNREKRIGSWLFFNHHLFISMRAKNCYCINDVSYLDPNSPIFTCFSCSRRRSLRPPSPLWSNWRW